jgi:hypothetical protein
MNLLEIYWDNDPAQHHLFAAMIMIPFIATSISLLHYNWYDERHEPRIRKRVLLEYHLQCVL